MVARVKYPPHVVRREASLMRQPMRRHRRVDAVTLGGALDHPVDRARVRRSSILAAPQERSSSLSGRLSGVVMEQFGIYVRL